MRLFLLNKEYDSESLCDVGRDYIGCERCKYDGVHITVWNNRVYPKEVQEAVISQTPRLVTVLKTERGGKNFFCPACANDVHFTYSHCTCCGQRLDWGENES